MAFQRSRGPLRTAAQALLVLHVVAVWALCLWSWAHPIANWDIIPYAALSVNDGRLTDAQLSQRAYDDVRQHVGAKDFAPLIDDAGPDRAYRLRVHAEPAALKDNLRFYSVKPLFIALSRAVTWFTSNGASAAGLVSAVALALTASVLPFVLPVPMVGAALTWLLLLLGDPPITMAARIASPDTLAALFSLLTGAAFLRGWRWWVGAGCALLAILARPDAAILVVPILVGMVWVRRGQREAWWLAASAAVCFALFVALGRLGLPWSTLFWHTFVTREPYPSLIRHTVSIGEYMDVLRRTAPALLTWRVLLMFGAAVLIALAALRRPWRVEAVHVIAASAAANMVLHHLIFPIDEYGSERMFLGSYFLVLCVVAHIWQRQRAQQAVPVSASV